MVKYSWTEETYNKKVEEAESKLLSRRSQVELSEKNKERSELIEKEMWQQYEDVKNAKGLGHVEEDDT